MLLQFPVFIVLYGVIRGLTNTVTRDACSRARCAIFHHRWPGSTSSTGPSCDPCTTAVCADPRYISESTKLYQNLVASHGQMMAFGINLSDKALGHHGSFDLVDPLLGSVLFAIGLQYLQMRQLNSRNPQYAQANPQAAALQKYMPDNLRVHLPDDCRRCEHLLHRVEPVPYRHPGGGLPLRVLDKKPVPTEEVLPGRRASSGAPRRWRRRSWTGWPTPRRGPSRPRRPAEQDAAGRRP